MLIVFIGVLVSLLTTNLWYDELCTTPLILGYNINGIICQLVYDAHGPAYFILLKLFAEILGNSIIVMKTFNIVISIIMVLVCYFTALKMVDRKYALIVSFLLCFLPTIYNEVYQIRMYSIAPLFLFLVAKYAYKLYSEPRKLSSSILFIFFSILTIYTHLFALVGVAFIHLILYIGLIKENKTYIKRALTIAIITALTFVPWIPVLIQQTQRKKITIETKGDDSSAIGRILKNLMYPFYTGNYAVRDDKLNYLLTLVLLIATAIITYLYLRIPKNNLRLKENRSLMMLSLTIPISIIILLTIYSILATPIWYSRYMVIFFPMMVFGFGYMIYNLNSRIQYIYLTIIFICFLQKIKCIHQITSDRGLQKYSALYDSKINKNDIIIDANLYTSTYFSSIKQYALKENQSNNCEQHSYWNIELIEGYQKVVENNSFFWSPTFHEDSIFEIGNKKYFLIQAFNYNYKYQHEGNIAIYKYEKSND